MGRMLARGMNSRAVANSLGIAVNTVQRFILSFLLRPEPEVTAVGDTFDIDEQRTFVGKKEGGECWLMYAFSHARRTPHFLQVGRRTKSNLQQMVNKVLDCSPAQIITDRLPVFKSIVPKDMHRRGKRANQLIERQNLNNRKDIARLARRTMCYSKSEKHLEAHVRFYFWFANAYNNKALVL